MLINTREKLQQCVDFLCNILGACPGEFFRRKCVDLPVFMDD